MGRWLTRRLLITAITFVGISVLVFALMRMVPVDPVDLMLFNLRSAGGLTAEDIAHIREQMRRDLGLDQPIPLQYLFWVREALTHGSLGFSFSTGRSALEMVLERLPGTLQLMGLALVIELVVGIPLGIIAALRRNRLTDYVISAFGLSIVAVPTFFLALLAIYIFSVNMGLLPIGGMYTPTQPGFDLIDRVRHIAMPALILGLAGVGPVLRYVRTSILETLGKDYLVTARAKGLQRNPVVVRHAFPNALLPLITYVGLEIGRLMAGAFVVEQIFTWPGMGSLALTAIDGRDYPVIQAYAIVVAAVVLLGNLAADVAYGVADPRIRLE
jgi:peptide/nickel transport system permease protein